MKKATLTSVKSFIKKNSDNLYLLPSWSFIERKIDDCEIDLNAKNFGINGAFISNNARLNSYFEIENGFLIVNPITEFKIITV